MAMIYQYIPYIFDSEEAWLKTIHDPRVTLRTPFVNFMEIYITYRAEIQRRS